MGKGKVGMVGTVLLYLAVAAPANGAKCLPDDDFALYGPADLGYNRQTGHPYFRVAMNSRFTSDGYLVVDESRGETAPPLHWRYRSVRLSWPAYTGTDGLEGYVLQRDDFLYAEWANSQETVITGTSAVRPNHASAYKAWNVYRLTEGGELQDCLGAGDSTRCIRWVEADLRCGQRVNYMSGGMSVEFLTGSIGSEAVPDELPYEPGLYSNDPRWNPLVSAILEDRRRAQFRPPTVTVAADPTSVRPEGTVQLTATAEDPDGGEVTYAWSAASGSFDATDQATATWTAPSELGPEEIQVTVTDDEDETASDTVTVTVTAPAAPTVTVAADSTSVRPEGTVQLTATAEDPDGGEVTYAWSAASGSFDATDQATATWTAPAAPGPEEIQVTVTDDEGETASDTVTVTVVAAPTVTVAADPTSVRPEGTVQLTATAEDPDGGEVTYAWSAASGSFDATDQATATWTAPAAPGPEEIQVTVTDDEGETASDTVTVTVVAAPTVTVAADPLSVRPEGTVQLTATAEDPDGGEVTYAWSAASGSFDATDQATATWTAPAAPGPEEIQVTVTDDEGETASDTVTVTVVAAPTVTVAADPLSVRPGGTVQLTATAEDPDGGEVTYAWSAASGSFDATDQATATWTAPAAPGPEEIQVTVTDDEGETASDTVTVTVVAAPTVTVAADPLSVRPGGTVQLTATAEDPDGGEVTYAWSAASGSFDATDQATATWTAPAAPGPEEIQVTVTDDEGETASDTVTVTVVAAPTVTVAADPLSVRPGGTVQLTATAEDPDGGEVTYAWSAASGSFDATDQATATWTAPAAPGPEEIQVTVTDDEGETASDTVTVTVVAPAAPAAPTVTVAANPTSVSPGGTVQLTATAEDPDGGEVTYAWSAASGSFDATDQATATWTAPSESGPVDITVTVTDDEGETASDTVAVRVLEPVATLPGLAALLLAGLLIIGAVRARSSPETRLGSPWRKSPRHSSGDAARRTDSAPRNQMAGDRIT